MEWLTVCPKQLGRFCGRLYLKDAHYRVFVQDTEVFLSSDHCPSPTSLTYAGIIKMDTVNRNWASVTCSRIKHWKKQLPNCKSVLHSLFKNSPCFEHSHLLVGYQWTYYRRPWQKQSVARTRLLWLFFLSLDGSIGGWTLRRFLGRDLPRLGGFL